MGRGRRLLLHKKKADMVRDQGILKVQLGYWSFGTKRLTLEIFN
jgi:hypothetical protein